MMNRRQVIEHYQAQLADQQQRLQRLAAQWKQISYVRGGMFLLCLVPLVLGVISWAGVSTPWYGLSAILFLLFLVVVFYHEGLQAKLRVTSLSASMHRESLARCQRQWNEISVPAVDVPPQLSAVSQDLDLFTSSSVYKLLGITRTPNGIETLKQWIMEGADPVEIKLRQQAVAELKSDFSGRQAFRLECEHVAAARSGPSGFVEWAESDDWLRRGFLVLWISRITAIVSLVVISAGLTGFISVLTVLLVLAGTCGLNFLLSVWFAGRFHDIFNQISSRSDEALHFAKLLQMIVSYPAESEKLTKLQRRLKDPKRNALAAMRKLGTLTGLANIRRSGLLFIPYILLELLTFWDVHCLDLLEKWKRKHGRQVRGWFEDLGQWEALTALAKLAADQPDWVFPEVVEPGSSHDLRLQATQLGHPLLADQRVCNDVTVGPPGTVLLVTSSNMSGKSTLLRSVGVNVVLAQMGSVVCAQSMRMPPLRIETSMRIADSLADGVSFFMAELKRLKEVVDTAGRLKQNGQKITMLFLLDEILQGTNSRERQIAVSRVVRKLIDQRAIGCISTHDLDLATTAELKNACDPVYFCEQFFKENGKQQMTFDYQMRQGVAATTNALKLLDMVGLGTGDVDDFDDSKGK